MSFSIVMRGKRANGEEPEIWPLGACLHSFGPGYVVLAYEPKLCRTFPSHADAEAVRVQLPADLITEVVPHQP